MIDQNLRVLIVDDDEDDYVLIRDILTEVAETKYDLEWVSDYYSALSKIVSEAFDVCLFDFRLGAKTGLELLREAINLGCKAPVILLTGQGDHETDVLAMKTGAYDFLIKNEVNATLLERSIRYAIGRKKMEDELFQEKERAVVTLESIGDSVITIDIAGNVSHLNPVAEKITGWQKEQVQGIPFTKLVKLVHEVTRECIENPISKVLSENSIINLPPQCLLINKHGFEFAIEGTASPICNCNDTIIGIVLIIHDVTENRELSRKLTYQASHDQLTGLVNRTKFDEELSHLIKQTQKYNEEHVLFCMDLDNFKIINDTCGHFAGDQLLKQISSIMKKLVRQSDVIARLGGDEFGILFRACAINTACQIADKICQAIKTFRFVWKEKPFTLGISIGIVSIKANCHNSDTVMSAADRACYIAKEKGGNRYHLFSAHDDELNERHDQMQLMTIISKALENDQFCLHVQPIVPLTKSTQKNHTWFELLIRMNESGQLIYPNSFLPAAHRYNMMPSIDKWVFNNFCSYFVKNIKNTNYPDTLMFNLNISGASLNEDFFVDFIIEQIRHYQIPAHAICFEITETIAIANFNLAYQFIQRLTNIGCQFALDDFGNGLSSFNYLKHLPVNYLKIGGNFVKSIVESKLDFTMIKAINDIAHLMKIQTIAEYVENESILNQLLLIGVDYIQGYLISKPKSITDIDIWDPVSATVF